MVLLLWVYSISTRNLQSVVYWQRPAYRKGRYRPIIIG